MIKTWKKSSRSVRLQVLVCPEDYVAWHNFAADLEIKANNDSDLVRKLIARVQNINKLDLDVYILRDRTKQLEQKVAERDQLIETQQNKISILKSERLQAIADLDQLKENIKKKRRQKK